MTRTEKKYKKVRKALSQADFPKNSVISFSVRRAKLRNAGILVIPAFFRILGYDANNSDANVDAKPDANES